MFGSKTLHHPTWIQRNWCSATMPDPQTFSRSRSVSIEMLLMKLNDRQLHTCTDFPLTNPLKFEQISDKFWVGIHRATLWNSNSYVPLMRPLALLPGWGLLSGKGDPFFSLQSSHLARWWYLFSFRSGGFRGTGFCLHGRLNVIVGYAGARVGHISDPDPFAYSTNSVISFNYETYTRSPSSN